MTDPGRETWQAMLKRRLPRPLLEPSRAALRGARRAVVWAHASRLAGHHATASFYCVYRRKNAKVVAPLVAQARALGWPVLLWALDEAAPSLTQWTAGTGTGSKFALCNRLLAQGPPGLDAHVIICDDDVRFHAGDLARLLAVTGAAGLDISQPSHDLHSHFSHAICVRQEGSLARLSGFVEIGPLFVVGPRARDRVIPFDERRPMGWGLEIDWSALARDGLRLGIVDATSVEHLGPVGRDYDVDEARTAMNAELGSLGLRDLADLATDGGTWWAGTRRAPWSRRGGNH